MPLRCFIKDITNPHPVFKIFTLLSFHKVTLCNGVVLCHTVAVTTPKWHSKDRVTWKTGSLIHQEWLQFTQGNDCVNNRYIKICSGGIYRNKCVCVYIVTDSQCVTLCQQFIQAQWCLIELLILVNNGTGNGLMPEEPSHYLNQCWHVV